MALSLTLAGCAVSSRPQPHDLLEPPTPQTQGSSSPSASGLPVLEQDDADEAGTPVIMRMKPGVPYLVENPGGAKLCMDDPAKDKSGNLLFPIDPRYAHLPMVGQVFTAWNCGGKRLAQLPSVTDGAYTKASTVWLTTKPSPLLRDTLKRIGFACATKTPAESCTQWKAKPPLDIEALVELMYHAQELKKDM
ncbi:MAG: hypothetical protein G01um101425_652 [Candidatus Peregrinibacteria bacterium Gr01-1014_25]|nr:MAG: hypothetical protein G01um101425_652 [Candidatus Peregrinibacteria bacterium Gr01-1014_25]